MEGHVSRAETRLRTGPSLMRDRGPSQIERTPRWAGGMTGKVFREGWSGFRIDGLSPGCRGPNLLVLESI